MLLEHFTTYKPLVSRVMQEYENTIHILHSSYLLIYPPSFMPFFLLSLSKGIF